MKAFTKRVLQNEKGQILPSVLCLLVLGGFIVVPALNFAATNIEGCNTIEKSVNGVFAADAGVEYAYWCLENSVTPPSQLSENINQMEVALQVEAMGAYTLYFGELIQAGGHSNYLGINGEIVWDDGAQSYKYTITVTWQSDSGKPTIHLEEVGARLPDDYGYQIGSANNFPENLSTAEPEESTDEYGALMLRWAFSEPLPSVSESNPVETQTFYIDGEGDTEGHYAWVVASRDDIGEVGEVTGTLYKITATATDPGDMQTTAEIISGVIQHDGLTSMVSWQVTR